MIAVWVYLNRISTNRLFALVNIVVKCMGSFKALLLIFGFSKRLLRREWLLDIDLNFGLVGFLLREYGLRCWRRDVEFSLRITV